MQSLPAAPPPTRRRCGDLRSPCRFLAPALRDAGCRARLRDTSAPAIAGFAGTVGNCA
jgi:hypothetical protein